MGRLLIIGAESANYVLNAQMVHCARWALIKTLFHKLDFGVSR